ncbi:hypothetical protein [Ammoniphilus resinae]|uniref:Uncharacterized protein n=1 Tax=Ammoniphilus resinae TaxID=861532 RepID=A0ABS4GVK3_9BACL|nr:hypothetical protein [Ammoniphilus resinae]MBP1933910.1 hypothetical protein [Ammoniphilus resinae]
MNTVAFLVLLIITIYTFGFAVSMWKEKRKLGAVAVFFLTLTMIVLPFFSIFR